MASPNGIKAFSFQVVKVDFTTAGFEWEKGCVLAFLTRRGGPWLRDARRRSPVLTS